jgi:hypothetical protein
MAVDNEGILLMQPTGRWTVCRSGQPPAEITSGKLFLLEVDGKLLPTRMEFRHFTGPMKGRELWGQPGEYISVDGYPLRNGVPAAVGI